MQWFYIQRLSDAPSGGTTVQYLGPFYGNPMEMKALMTFGYHVMVFTNSTWVTL
jgi:hypothetical protein